MNESVGEIAGLPMARQQVVPGSEHVAVIAQTPAQCVARILVVMEVDLHFAEAGVAVSGC